MVRLRTLWWSFFAALLSRKDNFAKKKTKNGIKVINNN